MRFHPSEEQLAIQDALRGTLADAMPAGRLHDIVGGESDFDRASWDALMALGLGGLALPEAAGGAGLGLVDLAMAVEVLGQGAVVGPVIQHVLAGIAVSRAADAAARDAWLGRIATGEVVATIALGGEWLPESWDVTVADGKASGIVRFVPGAGAASLFVVGTTGGGLALVEAGDGVSLTAIRSSDRTRRLSTVSFDGAKATMLFDAGDPQVARIFDAGLVLVASDALGGGQYCVDLSVSYAKEREQFGQPIGRFQALKHQLATMALEIEPARPLVWYAAYAQDAGLEDAPRAAAMAKAHLADRFVSVARAAVAAHGGIGYTWEYGLNIWFRRSLFDRAYLGSPAVHRARAADMAGW
jgi:alkylation response protein AidB-like acyl-CoA dehydrogenase